MVELYGCGVVMSENGFLANLPSFAFCVSGTLWKLDLACESEGKVRLFVT